MINPCINCLPPVRHPGCKSKCADGITYKAWDDERKQRINAERRKDTEYALLKKDRIFATKRKAGMI
jgi:hypothetical protein